MKRYVVLACGGRDMNDQALVHSTLDLINRDKAITKLVQGYARGADRLAHEWALPRGVPSTGKQYEITPKMWREQCRGAGYRRNKKMRDEQRPDIVVAFPGGNGTQMMIDLAHEKKIPVLHVLPDGSIV